MTHNRKPISLSLKSVLRKKCRSSMLSKYRMSDCRLYTLKIKKKKILNLSKKNHFIQDDK